MAEPSAKPGGRRTAPQRVEPGEVVFDDADKPKRPLDPWPGDPPKKAWPEDMRSFVIDIDWSVNLSDEAVRRIEKQLRQAVFAELAQIEHGSDLLVRSARYRGAHGIEIVSA